ncbi:MAG: metal-dependent transcriptional regulator [Elusimicrobia bacterium]|nr:metal-dependent transcriptional regulator [Candidatus Liberimonas magnetica]
MIDKNIEEALSIIWELKEKKMDDSKEVFDEITKRVNEKTGELLIKDNYVTVNKDKIELAPEGEKIATDIIRRQRIAERLLCDVLDITKEEAEHFACELEHTIPKEVEDSICTLLGHPRQNPHGAVIPEGECCRKAKTQVESIIVPLTKLKSNDKAKISYILSGVQTQLHKLMSLGILPGSIIKVHQTFPSYVIQSKEIQIALEDEIAENIYVKKLPK